MISSSFILLLAFFASANAFSCPLGAIPTRTNKEECYLFVAENKYYLEAEDICEGNQGHLVSIHNMMDNMFISQEALKTFDHSTTGDFWIGLSNIVQTNWSWIDSKPFDFFNWKDETQADRTDAACASMLFESGLWISDYCMIQKPFVCMVPAIKEEDEVPATELPTPPPPPPPTAVVAPKDCPPSWSFYETTGFCYKAFENADWNAAQYGCRQNDAHLASIHSLEEAMFVGILAYIPGAEQCDGSKQAWIGLYSNDNNLSWQWTDGTPYDYNKWGNTQPDFPESQHCVQLFSSSNQCNWFLGDFDNYDCNAQLASYICKKAPA